MKRLIIFIIFLALLCLTVEIRAQDLSISFSFSEESDSSFNPLSPFLKICYINNGSDDYYFPSLFYLNAKVPLFSEFFISRSSPKYVLGWSNNFVGDHYYLRTEFLTSNNYLVWGLEPSPKGSPHPPLEVGDYITAYNQLHFPQEVAKLPSAYELHLSRQQLQDSTYIRNSNVFVFLKSGETITQEISLRAFKEAQINIEIYLKDVLVPIAMRIGDLPSERILLPDQVYGYYLYTGTVDSNCLVVEFSPK